MNNMIHVLFFIIKYCSYLLLYVYIESIYIYVYKKEREYKIYNIIKHFLIICKIVNNIYFLSSSSCYQ